MPRTNKIIQSLNAGELSPLMDFRIDQDKYQMGCRTMENFYPLIYGGAERRPGTYYAGTSKTAGLEIRLIDFVYSVDQAYILEFGNQYIRVFVNNGRFVGELVGGNAAWATGTKYYAGDMVDDGTTVWRCLIGHTSDSAGGDGTGGTPVGDANTTQWENTLTTTGAQTSDLYPIYEIPTPYLTADLFQIKIEQSADVMYITHPNYEPRKLSRISSTTFVLEELAFADGPFIDENSVTTAVITPSDTTGTVTLTASGTNANGTAFEPFKTGTTAGHAPSGATGAAAVGTSQTLKSITGALFRITHATDANEVDKTFNSVSTSDSLFVRKGVQWDFITNGTWTGTINLERSYDQVVWEVLHTVISADNSNVQLDGTEEVNDAYYRMNATDWTSGSANCQLQVRDSSVLGVVEITSVSSPTVATGTVLTTLGSTDATHRWSEGYWSNYRGWPNAVAISSEERLTFVGSTSFPLTTWGSVSGDYTSMKIGVLDDDAIIFTLVGSGRQNEILWIVSKNALILGTYGGEHLLGASDDKEAMTPSNVRAVIQSTYGSHDIQAILVGDAVLFIQRGGRKVREMHYDFAKDTQVSDDLTVFSNHITESQIKDIAYQRTPDPMIWCTREDGQMAVMSYERAQEVYSWCRVLTSTNAISPATDPTESDIESVAVIPTSGEEDQVWISVERDIPGIAGYDANNLPRYIEYFSTRDF
jgi:hypothetical protein